MREKYGLFKRKRKKGIIWYFWYYEGQQRITKSTGQRNKYEAKIYVEEYLKRKDKIRSFITFRKYAEKYFIWNECPHIRRLLDERKSITKRHAHNQRLWLEKYVFTDQISDKQFNSITRADLIDFRSRLLRRIPDHVNTVNKVMATVKTIFREALIREEIDHDPTFGIGNIKEDRKIRGIFTINELRKLFPEDSYGPWLGLQDYTCFLLAASTGMRRGEVLALPWKNLNLNSGYVVIDRAWKGNNELGKPKWEHSRVTPFLLFPERVVQSLKDLYEESIRIGPEDLVFCYDNGERLGDTWWKKHFNKAIDKLKIDRKGRLLSPHSFRHTLNTLLRDAGRDPAKIREVLGWRQERVQDNYTHFQIEHFRDLWILD